MKSQSAVELATKFRERNATIGIIGLGYVGLPLARSMAAAGFDVIGFDIDEEKIAMLARGEMYLRHLPAEDYVRLVREQRFKPTTDFSRITLADAVIICVPTPLTRNREPDLTFIESTARIIAPYLRPGQLVVLESTTYPGTTRDVLKPLLERDDLKCGRDLYLAFSPEREDPGNTEHASASIPKVVGGDGTEGLELALALYDQAFDKTVPVTTLETAEAVKITENIFRAVNIALVNELKLVYGRMGIDIWEVIEAAKSKPFGYMPFYPGPGLGGHCIPIDPYYLAWKAREYDMPTRFIELAGEINASMPTIVVRSFAEQLSRRFSKSIAGSRVLLIGLAYKKNVDDTRESPTFSIIRLLEGMGAIVAYYDPYVLRIPVTREHAIMAGRMSVALTAEVVKSFDAAIIVTDHDNIDYRLLVENSPLVIDTRNAISRAGIGGANVCKA